MRRLYIVLSSAQHLPLRLLQPRAPRDLLRRQSGALLPLLPNNARPGVCCRHSSREAGARMLDARVWGAPYVAQQS